MGETTREKGFLKLVHPGRFVELHRRPIIAAEIMRKNPRHVVTCPDVFKFPWIVVRPESMLKPGYTFYLVPYHTIHGLIQTKDPENSKRQRSITSNHSTKLHGSPNQRLITSNRPPKLGESCEPRSPKQGRIEEEDGEIIYRESVVDDLRVEGRRVDDDVVVQMKSCLRTHCPPPKKSSRSCLDGFWRMVTSARSGLEHLGLSPTHSKFNFDKFSFLGQIKIPSIFKDMEDSSDEASSLPAY